MEIVPIFAHEIDGDYYGLHAVRFSPTKPDEFKRIFRLWNDPEYLFSFFNDYDTLLSENFGGISAQESVSITRKEAQRLENKFREVARAGINEAAQHLDTLFMPLHASESKMEMQKRKAYGLDLVHNWIRVYGLRVGPHCYVVTGGGIKLVRAMQDSTELVDELIKLSKVRDYLREENCYDEAAITELVTR